VAKTLKHKCRRNLHLHKSLIELNTKTENQYLVLKGFLFIGALYAYILHNISYFHLIRLVYYKMRFQAKPVAKLGRKAKGLECKYLHQGSLATTLTLT
jgi:hypothetical protein